MTTSHCLIAAALIAWLASTAAPAHAQRDLAWVSEGNQEASITSYVINDLGGNPMLGTAWGYRVLVNGNWQAFEEPGVPGRAVHALTETATAGTVITGRVDAAGHGYLERNHGSAQGEVVYSSTCGAFVDLAGGTSTGSPLWGCSRAGDTPGEMVVSLDQGATWQVVTGHGQHDLHDLILDFAFSDAGYVVGDMGIAFTPDNGATWQDLTAGLPASAIRRLWEPTGATGLPAKSRWGTPVWVCTDAGLFVGDHDRAAGTCVWDPTPLLAGGVQAYGQFMIWEDYFGELALMDDGRVLLDPPLSGEWVDVTGSLAGLEILPVESSVIVATAEDGLWLLSGLLTPVTDVPPPPPLAVTAVPNPFNPATTVHFTVPQAGHARLTIHDLAGRRVATLVDADVAAGPGTVVWRPQELGSGVYVARLEAAGLTTSARLVLVR